MQKAVNKFILPLARSFCQRLCLEKQYNFYILASEINNYFSMNISGRIVKLTMLIIAATAFNSCGYGDGDTHPDIKKLS